jgi:hypothetical protein
VLLEELPTDAALSDENELEDDAGLELDAEVSGLGVKLSELDEVVFVPVGSIAGVVTACGNSWTGGAETSGVGSLPAEIDCPARVAPGLDA